MKVRAIPRLFLFTLGFISRPVTTNLTQRLIPRNASRRRHEFFWDISHCDMPVALWLLTFHTLHSFSVYQMEFAIVLAVLFASALLPLLFSKDYQSLRYYGLAGLVLLSVLSVLTPTAWMILSALPSDFLVFPALFLIRYTRLVVNLIAYCLYKPTAVLQHPTLKPSDVSVIIPTVEGEGEEFLECVSSVYANMPAKIIIVTAGPDIYNRALKSVGSYENVIVKNCSVQNKRRQICVGLQEV